MSSDTETGRLDLDGIEQRAEASAYNTESRQCENDRDALLTEVRALRERVATLEGFAQRFIERGYGRHDTLVDDLSGLREEATSLLDASHEGDGQEQGA